MFKLGGRLELAGTFSAILAQATTVTEMYRPEHDELHREKTRPILISVPSAHKRLREQGFWPAAEIALGLGEILNLPVAIRGLKRRDTFQSGFKTGQHLPSDIVLVDDVVTTGATV